jgi:ferredoxin
VNVVRVHVDWTRCDGHGSCAELLPELLESDEWGYPLSRSGVRDPEVPTDLEQHARRAVKACPLQALRLVATVSR